jgi:hypothetical protein
MQLEPSVPRRLRNGAVVRTDYRLLECTEDLLKTMLAEGCGWRCVPA